MKCSGYRLQCIPSAENLCQRCPWWGLSDLPNARCGQGGEAAGHGKVTSISQPARGIILWSFCSFCILFSSFYLYGVSHFLHTMYFILELLSATPGKNSL